MFWNLPIKRIMTVTTNIYCIFLMLQVECYILHMNGPICRLEFLSGISTDHKY